MNYYDQIAEGYDELHGNEQRNKLIIFKSLIQPKENERLLDVGCGSGISTEPWNCVKIGIDPSEKLIKIGNKQNRGKLIQGYGEELPFENDSFDYIISISAIQNFTNIRKGLEEIKRVSKSNSKIVISTLKRSSKITEIETNISELFKLEDKIIEDIDVIYVISNKK